MKNNIYEVVYAHSRNEEIQKNFLKKRQLNAHMARWFFDYEYNQLLWSDGLYEMLELNPKEYGANHAHILSIIHPKDRSLKNKSLKQLRTETKPIEITYRLLFPDGRLKWINEICCTDFDETGRPIRSYGTVQDITKYKLSEERFRQKEERFKNLIRNESRLVELVATKDKFFSIIAHDLRNPFNSLLGIIELMLEKYDETTDQEKKEYLKLMQTNTSQTLTLLNSLLEWAKVQTGKISFQPANNNLNQIVSEATEAFALALKLKHISLNLVFPEEMVIFADRDMLKTIFRNLIHNAIKYSYPEESIDIIAAAKKSEIEVTIADNGIGMSAETISKLFRVDSRTSIPGTGQEKGTGFGLLLCKELIEKHNGKIGVESEPGKGSRFIFTMPTPKIAS